MIEQRSIRRIYVLAAILLLLAALSVGAAESPRADRPVATFSIVAYDSTTGELGVAVASKFFAVGSVVPWARADVGAVATQAFANTTFGPRGLELMERGLTPQEAIDVLIHDDDRPQRRQVGMVDAMGRSATFTGDSCLVWAGGRKGPGYAVQGNILAGEAVVAGMEKAWLETKGSISDRLYAALLAAEENGGDARGKQSAALLVVREGAGYGGYTDRAIDIRVDDSPEPFKELGRILKIAQMWDAWNMAWTAFTKQQYAEALPPMQRAAALAPDYGEVQYDLAVIRLSNGDRPGALEALSKAIELNPGLAEAARTDGDLEGLHGDPEFDKLTSE
jgi:uncharacterized Ntn-hydrolase superfamily protein